MYYIFGEQVSYSHSPLPVAEFNCYIHKIFCNSYLQTCNSPPQDTYASYKKLN